MIEKKASSANLEKNRATIFGIGLIAAGSFTLAAFTYTSPLEVEEAKIASAQTVVNYEIQQQDEPQKPETETLVEETTQDEPMQDNSMQDLSENTSTKKNEKSAQDANVRSGLDKRVKGPGKIKVKIRDVKSAPVEFTDVEAQYIGGFKEMSKFIVTHLEYPEQDVQIGNQGKAYVRFVVEEDGSISNVKATGDVSRRMKREAERIVRSFPNWIPGELNGKYVRSYVRLPIAFVLD